jgi:outer membrane protein TolC
MKRGAYRLTTTRSWMTGVLLIVAAVIFRVGPAQARTVTEEELVRAFLGTGSEKGIAAAARARQRAVGLTKPYLPKPGLVLRQEQSFGAATKFSTTVAGVSLSLEIGGRHGLLKQAASLDAAALGFVRQAAVIKTVCDLRRQIRAVHAEQQTVSLLADSQRRLERLPRDLKRLVAAGERAQFDLDRMLLLVRNHRQTLARHQAHLKGLLAGLSSLSGLNVTAVRMGSGAPPAAPGHRGGAAAPSIRALRMQAQAESKRIAEARRRWIPNLDLYGAYRLDVGGIGDAGHGYEVGLTLNLPVTASERVLQAAAEARRRTLLATATRQQALKAARLASLRGKAQQLKRSLSGEAGDPDKLTRDATRRYLSGVGSLPELVDTIRAVNEAAIQRAHTESALRSISLEAACLQESFDEKSISQLATEETP